MTSRVHLGPREIVDSSGNLITNASVRVLQPGTTIPITDTLWQASSGGSAQSQPWVPSSGIINFYLDRPQTVRIGITPNGGTEFFFEDIDVGLVDRWRRTVKDFGAKGDGVTDDAVAIQAAINAIPTGGVLHFTEGVYIVGTTITLPTVTGAAITGPAPASNARRSAATLQAKSGASLVSILASAEWYNNGAVTDGQGLTISNLTLWGGGFSDDGPSHDATIETTANTQYSLVLHGSNHKVYNVLFMSANVDGFLVAGTSSRNGTTIGETHELWVEKCGIRYVGRDAFHVNGGAQDGYIGRTKVQYAGRHAFCTDSVGNTAAWDFDHNHPSRCGSDFFNIGSGWETNLSHNYLDAVGDFMDHVTTPWRTLGTKRYGIYIGGGADNPCHIDHNRMHTESSGGQQDPVVGMYLSGWVIATYNTLRYQTTDSSVTMIELPVGGLPAYAVEIGNKAHMPGGG